jgi:hypothetical protein
MAQASTGWDQWSLMPVTLTVFSLEPPPSPDQTVRRLDDRARISSALLGGDSGDSLTWRRASSDESARHDASGVLRVSHPSIFSLLLRTVEYPLNCAVVGGGLGFRRGVVVTNVRH